MILFGLVTRSISACYPTQKGDRVVARPESGFDIVWVGFVETGRVAIGYRVWAFGDDSICKEGGTRKTEVSAEILGEQS